MPLRALFNPAAYSSANISTAKLCFKTTSASFPSFSSRRGRTVANKRNHSTTTSGATSASATLKDTLEGIAAPWEQLFGLPNSSPSPSTAAPASCCPHHAPLPAPIPFNQDSAYWRVHRPSAVYERGLYRKFHEIEQLYRGNVEYVKRMGEQSPGLLEGLAFKGQKPPFCIVDCSDSRVNEQGIFDAEPGTMFTAGNIANMFDEGDANSNAVLAYAVGTLKVKHVVVMGHYGCGGVAASMAPLPKGYAEKWLGHTTFPPLPASSSSSSSTSSLAGRAGEEEPADLAVQRWILPIRRLYETSGRLEIRAHRERITALIKNPDSKWTRESVAERLMSAPEATALGAGMEGGRLYGDFVGVGGGIGRKFNEFMGGPEIKRQSDDEQNGGGQEVRGIHLHDPAFRALVEENVKANVWRLVRSRVVRDHYKAYTASLSTSQPMNPIYVHGWVYDLENGVVSDLEVSSGPPGWVPPPGGVQGGFPVGLGRG